MSRNSFLLPPTLADYYRDVAVRADPLLDALREETARLPEARMQIAPEQGQLLQLLVAWGGARRAIEIGVFTGYSALCIARALPPNGQLLACDVSAQWTAIAASYWERAGVRERVDLRLAPAMETLDAALAGGEAECYDFAFIDADKESYIGYYQRCLQLLRPGGLIAVDNTLWGGRVADTGDSSADTAALREFNALVAADTRVDLCLLPIGDGLTLLRRR